ncbi:MAG: cation diffusion facilitator family transporter [Candidatus Omnitrophica bacterium]|jgi:cation diffusion facilitator family transporter|nr:cation diffusion facilitator family transporter [Candidatus Omnitrophota bacterium]
MEMNLQQHYSHIRKVLILVLVLNWAVAFAKIIYGLTSRCSSMAADGFHSLADGTSNIIGLIGIHFACQPRDEDHPYGHKKYETFFSLGIAALLFLVCFELIQEGIRRLIKPVTPEINTASFIVMLLTLGVNFWVMNYERKKGTALRSDILVSDAMHTRADIFTSFSVIVTLVAIKLGFPLLDAIATLLIALFIAHAAFDIIKDSSRILCDTVVLEEKRITDIVLGVKGVRNCHKIRTRGRPDDIYVDLHVQVNPDMHVDNAHRISYAIEDAIKTGIPEVTDVVVHIEPKD